MKKFNFFIVIFLFIVKAGLLFGQHEKHEKLISKLNFVLFEKDIDTVRYDYGFWSYSKHDSVHIISRYENKISKWKSGLVSAICDTIRWYGYSDLIPELTEILYKQENIFINEWEPIFNLIGGPEGLWEDQFNCLCMIDLTISYLTILNEKWSPSKKYAYIKNLYMLSYGDYDTSRVNNTIYKSKYIRHVRTGYCQCLIQGGRQNTNLIDEFFYCDPNMINVLINDIELKGKNLLPDSEQKFYSIGLENVLLKFRNFSIDSLIVNDPKSLINIGYNNKIDHWLYIDYPIEFYHLVLKRFKLSSKNPELIDLLLDDIFKDSVINDIYKNKHSISNSLAVLALVQGQEDHLINYMISERFLSMIARSNNENDLKRLINVCNSTLPKEQKKYMIRKAFKHNLLSNEKLKILKDDLVF